MYANILSAVFRLYGGDGRDRTDDLHTASVALSQLSYAPISSQTVDFTSFRYAFYIQLSNAIWGSLPVGLRSQEDGLTTLEHISLKRYYLCLHLKDIKWRLNYANSMPGL